MLQQPLAGGAEQQAGETATSAGADHDDVMVVAGLGQCAGCGAGHDLLADLEVRVCRFKRLDAHIQILLEGRHDAFVLRALHVRHGGDDVQFGAPRIGERGRDLQRLQTPLGFVGADCHLGDGVVQVHQVAFVVGVRHHDDRAVRVCRQAGAGGAEQSFGQTTLAAVANDDEVVVARQFDEHGCGISGDDQRRCLDTLLVGDGLGLRQNLLRIVVRGIVIAHGRIRGIERHCRIAWQRICADDLQGQSRMLRVICCPPCRLVAGVGSIDTYEDCLVIDHERPPLNQVAATRLCVAPDFHHTARHAVFK